MKHVPMDKDQADKALLAFKKVADGLGLDWCLFAGTALGMFRDGKFIPHDDDIDLAVKASTEKLDLLWWELSKAGFTVGRFCENVDGTKNRHTYYKEGTPQPEEGGILVDVFYAFTEEEKNLTMYYDAVPYKDELYLVPHPIEAYLQHAYGEWWNRELRNAAQGKEGISDH